MGRTGVCGWYLTCLAVTAASTGQAAPSVSVRLVTPATEYLVGEPVRIDTVVTNITRAELSLLAVPYEGFEHVIEVYVSRNGGKPDRFELTQTGCLDGRASTRKSGEAWHHPLSLLYSRERSGRLAFEGPGTYTVKVVYPLVFSESDVPQRIESNPIRVRIVEPTGVDEQVWRRIQAREVFDLIQLDDGPDQVQAVVALVRAFKAHPGSRYQRCYADALRRFARQGGERLLSPEVRDDPREVLGIPKSN